MDNQYDFGMAEDYNNMTRELGRKVWVYPRNYNLTYEGQDGDDEDTKDLPREEIVYLQELDTEHEVVASGQMNVGDVRFTFMDDSIAEEEGFVTPDEGATTYKILKLTKVRNMSNNKVIYLKGFGKKIPNR